MANIIQVLTLDRYIAPLNVAPGGQMATTHLANVKWTDNKAGRYYVKAYPVEHSKGLVNEITGYLLANAVGLKQPKKVAIIQIPKEVITNISSDDFIIENDYIWGWASEESGKSLNTYFNMEDVLQFERCITDLKKWDLFPDLLAFDDWVANQDRNTGNITYKGSNKFNIIDHGNVPVSESWKDTDLVNSKEYNNKLLDVLYEKTYPLPFSVAMVDASKNHKRAFDESICELEMWWDMLLNDKTNNHLKDFLKTRSIISVTRIKKRLGLLVA